MRVDNLTREQAQAITDRLRMPYLLIWQIGITTGIRISDILTLKARQFRNPYCYIKEKKTGKRRRLYLSIKVRQLATDYIQKNRIPMNGYVFDVSRQSVWRAFKAAARKARVNTNVGTHSMRKTYSSRYIAKGHTVYQLQRKLNHTHLQDTVGYLTSNSVLGLDERGYPKNKKKRRIRK